MKFSDEAVVISSSKFSENSLVINAFCHEHGLHRGLVKAHQSRDKRGVFMEGNIIQLVWNARLSEHLGSIKGELVKPVASHLFQDNLKLLCLRSALGLVAEVLPERQPHQQFYTELKHFLEILISDKKDWMVWYVIFELALIRELGFGVDLTECAATGTTDNLIYISPKTGRAVSEEAGEPYKDKLLKLPEFLLHIHEDSAAVSYEEVMDGLKIGGYFLEKSFNEIKHKPTPKFRDLFIHSIPKEQFSTLGK